MQKTKQTTTAATTQPTLSQEQYVQAKLAQYGVDAKLMAFSF